MKLYAFDVDHTLSVSRGPVTLELVRALREEGHITGLCGNWAMVVTHEGWHQLFSFLGPLSMTKVNFLRHIAQWIPASDYIMVGNVGDVPGHSQDLEAASLAGWRFIRENDFAAGKR